MDYSTGKGGIHLTSRPDLEPVTSTGLMIFGNCYNQKGAPKDGWCQSKCTYIKCVDEPLPGLWVPARRAMAMVTQPKVVTITAVKIDLQPYYWGEGWERDTNK